MDGKARHLDDIFIERHWRSLKYEYVYLHGWETGSQARAGVGRWITFYNHLRPHAAHGGQPPAAHGGQPPDAHGGQPPDAHGGQPPAVVCCNRIETDQQVEAVA